MQYPEEALNIKLIKLTLLEREITRRLRAAGDEQKKPSRGETLPLPLDVIPINQELARNYKTLVINACKARAIYQKVAPEESNLLKFQKVKTLLIDAWQALRDFEKNYLPASTSQWLENNFNFEGDRFTGDGNYIIEYCESVIDRITA